MKKALVLGGTSGLGLEIAESLSPDYNAYITGRKDPLKNGLIFKYLDLSSTRPLIDFTRLIDEIPRIDLLVYAAGYYQDGRIDDLTDEEIIDMNFVGLIGAELMLNKIMKKQNSLEGFIAITSTSQFIPREREPIYTGVKAGLAMFAKSISLDKRVEKTLVAAPSGMNTPFWSSTSKDASAFLDPKWVANEIVVKYKEEEYSYSEIRILREPPRVELIEENYR